MTWVTWRQQRLPLLIGLGLTLVLAAVVVALRLTTDAAIAELGADCGPAGGTGCSPGAGLELSERVGLWLSLLPLPLLALPVTVGALAGAPLFARDYEQGTHVWTLTQSVSRRRWWTTKVLVVGLPLTLAMAGLGLLVSWALDPIAYLTPSRLETPQFQIQGLAVAGYFLVAFAVAATLGLLLRNTVGAIALTVVAYLVLVPGLGLARGHYLPPEQVAVAVPATPPSPDAPAFTGPQVPEGGWQLTDAYYDARGDVVDVRYDRCSDLTDRAACLSAQGAVTERVTFQPADRFWHLQLIETGIAVVLAACALVLGTLRLRRRGV
jgi:hypothetical protein